MDQSQNDAKYVALTRLGYTVHGRPGADPRRRGVPRARPRTASVEPGDQVLAVDGTDVTDVGADRRSIVQAHQPGDDVSRHLRPQRRDPHRHRSSPARSVEGRRHASCVPAQGSTSGTACLGVVVAGVRHLPIPDQREDQHRSSSVGRRPGLAFTLAIIDDLTPGSLTGGKRVAVTGTIDADGIGRRGRRRRAEGDHRAHERRAAHDRAESGGGGRAARRGRRAVVGVDTVDEALAALQRAGGRRSAATVDDRGAIMSA